MTTILFPDCVVCKHFRREWGPDILTWQDDPSRTRPGATREPLSKESLEIAESMIPQMTGTCDAYPKGIPSDIWQGETKHMTPYFGDNGIQFEVAPGKEEEYKRRQALDTMLDD